MRRFWLLFLFIAQAQAANESWLIGGNKNEFMIIAPRGYLLNLSCAKNPVSCEAGRKAKNPVRVKEIEVGGKNPGSRGCLNAGGRVTMGRNLEEGTQAFCFFNDGSMASIDAF
jgi:hypothetical protein